MCIFLSQDILQWHTGVTLLKTTYHFFKRPKSLELPLDVTMHSASSLESTQSTTLSQTKILWMHSPDDEHRNMFSRQNGLTTVEYNARHSSILIIISKYHLKSLTTFRNIYIDVDLKQNRTEARMVAKDRLERKDSGMALCATRHEEDRWAEVILNFL